MKHATFSPYCSEDSNGDYNHFSSPSTALLPYQAPHPTPVAYRIARKSAEYLDVTTTKMKVTLYKTLKSYLRNILDTGYIRIFI